MPSQSKNKPFPVRLEPELRERIKEAGGGRLLRVLAAIYLQERVGDGSEFDHLEEQVRRLENSSASDFDEFDVYHLREDLLSTLRWRKDDLQRFRALNLLGRVEWLKHQLKRTEPEG